MSNYEHKDGHGSLFPNTKKTKDTQPDWRGDFKLDGKIYQISSWWKEGKNGREGFHSLKIEEKKPYVRRDDGPDRELGW